MNLLLVREVFSNESTVGSLSVDGQFECYTLEDKVRDVKVHGETAIPAGRYRVIINHSPRFGKKLPLLVDVPNFEGIRIHSGNSAKDTEGCILVGQSRSKNLIGSSRVAFNGLFKKLEAAAAKGEPIEISVRGGGSSSNPK